MSNIEENQDRAPERVRTGDELVCKVESLALGGRGLARHNGMAIFVRGGLPGQEVRVRVTKGKKRFADADAVEVLTQSRDYVEPVCPHFGRCGGCDFQNLSYDRQLREKSDQVTQVLRRVGGLELSESVPVLASPEVWRYRNKMEYAFTDVGNDLSLGLRQAGSNKVENVDACHLCPEVFSTLVNTAREFCRESNVPAYDPKTRRGFWRHLVIRTGVRSGQLMVHLITSRHAKEYSRALELGHLLRETCTELDGFVHSSRSSRRMLAFGERVEATLGKDSISERLDLNDDAVKFQVSANAFFQTNSLGAEVLYNTVRELTNMSGRETVFDLYCGSGGMGLSLAGKAANVVGFDAAESAVNDANASAALNGFARCEFQVLDLENRPGELRRLGAPDVVVCDPPRSGLTEAGLRIIKLLRANRVVYVACDPATLARDLSMLEGYEVKRVVAVDMFPHTAHVECAVLLVPR